MRKLVYWKRVPIPGKAWASFIIVPTQEFNEPHPIFDDMVRAVREAGFSYRVTRIDESLVEERL